MLFEDMGEQEHVFALLDELARQPNQRAAVKFTAQDHLLMKRLWALFITIRDYENELGFDPLKTSYQRSRVLRLIDMLERYDRADKLAAELPEIKELLLKAWAIDLEIVCGRMKPLADIGEARRVQQKEWGMKGAVARIKYSKDEKQCWLNEANRIRNINPALSMRALTIKVMKNLQLSASEKTVRNHLQNI